MLTVRFLPLASACLLVVYMSFQQHSTVADGQKNTDLQKESDISKTTSANRPLFSRTDESDFNDTETTRVAVLGQGRCEENVTENVTVTTACVGELLERPDTLGFRRSFLNAVKRTVVPEQLRFCPYSALCSFSFNLTLPKDNLSACARCSCPGDSTMLNPCPDALDFDLGDIHTKSYDCIPMYLKDPKIKADQARILYKVIHRCSDSNGDLQLCDTGKEPDLNFTDVLPVTDKTTGTTYINKPCAICNKANIDDLAMWKATVSCDKREAHEYASDTELIKFITDSPSCNLKYSLSEGDEVKAEKCPFIIQKCNETGNWKRFDPFISSVCKLYDNYYYVEVGKGKPRFTYRNIFCALCNGEVPGVYTVWDKEFIWKDPSHIFSFSGLLKLNFKEEKITGQSSCQLGYMYDVVRATCVKLLCSPLRHMVEDKCDLIYSEVAGVIYIVKAYLYPVDNPTKMLSEMRLLQSYSSFFNDVFFRNFTVRGRHTFYTKICFATVLTKLRQMCYADGSLSTSMTCSYSLDVYVIELHIQISHYHNLSDILDRYSNITEADLVLKVAGNGNIYQYQIKFQTIGKTESVNMFDRFYVYDRNCSHEAEKIVLSNHTGCALIELKSTDYAFFHEGDNMYLDAYGGVNLTKSQYIIDPSGTSLFVCADTYRAVFPFMKPVIMFDWQGILNLEMVVSVVCVSASLLCLLASLTTFSLFSSLRTLPGKNNMSLTFSLFCAQSCYLVGSYGQFEQESVVCIVVGLCTHFLWLVSIFWMNVCTFHVFRLFIGGVSVSTGRGIKTFICYWSYVVILSVILVLVNTLISLSNSCFSDIGYGKTSCYINLEKMMILTFVLPVGFVIFSNLVMFISVVCKIANMPKLQKDVKRERNDIMIFAKLSTLTGLCWIFGFIYILADIQLFSYLFIILNGSQGVFLFLSFVSNEKVLKMYKDKITHILTQARNFRTSNKKKSAD